MDTWCRSRSKTRVYLVSEFTEYARAQEVKESGGSSLLEVNLVKAVPVTYLHLEFDCYETSCFKQRQAAKWLASPQRFLSTCCTGGSKTAHLSPKQMQTATALAQAAGWMMKVSTAGRSKNFFWTPKHPADSGVDTASCKMGTRVLFPGWSDLCVKVASHLHLVPSLWMSGAVPPLPLYTFAVWTATILPCYFTRLRGTRWRGWLRYKPESREFDSRWSHWNFSVT